MDILRDKVIVLRDEVIVLNFSFMVQIDMFK